MHRRTNHPPRVWMNVVAGEINWHVCWDFGFLAISEYGHNNRVEELQHSTLDLASTTRRQASFLFSPNPLLHLLLIIVHCFRTFRPKKKKDLWDPAPFRTHKVSNCRPSFLLPSFYSQWWKSTVLAPCMPLRCTIYLSLIFLLFSGGSC